jgi:beta-phosphoglucomutase-like phosphatase (HAD superfamily)
VVIKAVVFDMDGVLIDARDWHYLALNEALGYFGYEISSQEHLTEFDGLPTKTKLRMLSEKKGLPKAVHSVIEDIKQDRTLRYAARFCFPSTQHQLLLGRLRFDGMKVGVATNSIRKTAEYMLEYSGVLGFLDSLTTNEDVDKPKPSPEIYIKACESLGVLPSETLVFEDNANGVRAATTAGCQVVQVDGPADVSLDLYFKFLENSGGVER